jgi:hypothetical protein
MTHAQNNQEVRRLRTNPPHQSLPRVKACTALPARESLRIEPTSQRRPNKRSTTNIARHVSVRKRKNLRRECAQIAQPFLSRHQRLAFVPYSTPCIPGKEILQLIPATKCNFALNPVVSSISNFAQQFPTWPFERQAHLWSTIC